MAKTTLRANSKKRPPSNVAQAPFLLPSNRGKPSFSSFLNEKGWIVTDGDNMSTNVPGVYAAGDVRQKFLRQVATAVGDGAAAATAAEKYIASLEH